MLLRAHGRHHSIWTLQIICGSAPSPELRLNLTGQPTAAAVLVWGDAAQHAMQLVDFPTRAIAWWLQHLFPELGVNLNERAYGGDCRLWIPEEHRMNWEVIKGTLFDEFVIAHTLGWW